MLVHCANFQKDTVAWVAGMLPRLQVPTRAQQGARGREQNIKA